MADELIKSGSNLPIAPQMNVSATDGGTAIGQVYGDVRIDATEEMVAQIVAKMIGPKNESHAAEWALLNQERFNVFVLENERYDCGSFCIGRRVALAKNTLPDYRDYYRPLTEPLIQELLNMPCIFAVRNQSFKRAPEHYPAFVGRLTDITCQGENIRFRFITCGRLRQQYINDNIRSFNLLTTTVRNQLDEEHWSIRTGNLLQIADAVGIEIK
jgi:hypothetical protein